MCVCVGGGGQGTGRETSPVLVYSSPGPGAPALPMASLKLGFVVGVIIICCNSDLAGITVKHVGSFCIGRDLLSPPSLVFLMLFYIW